MIICRQNHIVLSLKFYRRRISSTSRVIPTEELPLPAYKPAIVEKNKYGKWEADERFEGNANKTTSTFSMVLPPPNVTGKLHLGHALACTVQDVIARRRRSLGDNVLWVPGTDHAGIATQSVVEKHLKSTRNTTRQDLGREIFINEVLKWRDLHGDTISKQLRTLGCSLDWSRETFTMNKHHSHAVNQAFIELFNKGLIYRKKALVNWCNALKSTLSDMEVENITIGVPTEMKVLGYDRPVTFGLLHLFAYRVCDSNEEVVVATTMPETMLGDVAIAVHPDDDRYKHLKGKHVLHPFRKKPIPIIYDKFVDMTFGTGAVKITPAHSKVDYDVSKHHHLPLIQVINEEGHMINSEKFNNLHRYHCRDILLHELKELGLLKQSRPHQMTLPTCSRSGDIVYHLPKEQWFLKCSDLNAKAAESVKSNQLRIEPDKFVNTWSNWTDDNRDWCISRQLWWGHRIPAYKCTCDKDVIWIAALNETAATAEASKYLRAVPESIVVERDTDVLDTWFSSGIYPFAALGWPDTECKDYKTFYPLSLMATAHDILGFWVHRMVILGLELTGKLPFNDVLLHGVICDNKGAKMSKSKGNVIDPIDVINGISMKQLKQKSEEAHRSGALSSEELQKALAYHKSNFSNTNGIPECGVDALRFTLLSQDIKSHYINFDVANCHSNKLFCNKIWQSVQYTRLAFAKLKPVDVEITTDDLTLVDRWILCKLAIMVERVNAAMDSYNFHLATTALRTLIYNELCDVYLECTKPGFDSADGMTGYAHAHTLSAVLNTSLRCLSPFMVYLTEEVVPKIPAFEANIIHNFNDNHKKYFDFPQNEDFSKWKDEQTETRIDRLMSCVNLIRELRGLYNVSNKLRPAVSIRTRDSRLMADVTINRQAFVNMTRSCAATFDVTDAKTYVRAPLDVDTEVYVELAGEDASTKIEATQQKIRKKIKKISETLFNLEQRGNSKDKEIIAAKKKELEQLKRLM